MKIHHLLDGISIAITNEEHHFIGSHDTHISLSSLNDHDTWLARNLVRKGIYKLTNDSKHLVIDKDHATNKSVI